MSALLVVLLLAFAPAQQDTLTIRDCILKSGLSTELYSHPHLAMLRGPNVWEQADQDALRYGDKLTSEYVQTDTGQRKVSFIAYAGSVYAFVYMHWDDPRAHAGSTPGVTVWHGDCMLRLQ